VRPIIDEHIDSMLKYGIIEHSNSPWGAAVLLIPKAEPGTFRVAIDYRQLNGVTRVKDAYPLPRIDDALASMQGHAFFTALDCAQGFYQIPMATEEDRQKTAFRCHRGSFQFRRMPFGIINGPMIFQRYVDRALGPLNFRCALCYVDDVVVMSRTFEDHVRDLGQVFDALRRAGLTLRPRSAPSLKARLSTLATLWVRRA
jgi:hypothetical protein